MSITLALDPPLPCAVLIARGRRCEAPAAQGEAARNTDGSYFVRPICATCRDAAARVHEYPLPPDAAPEPCRSCGAPIVWTQTPRGAALPLSVATRSVRDGHPVALSHFRDCPDAKAWGR